MPEKSTGEIGATLITSGLDGDEARVIHVELPTNKEELEAYFASRFMEEFNRALLMGPGCTIASIKQNDTTDLDFQIECTGAKYLELAELNPRSEEFGRAAYRTGRLSVYDYARWIFFRIMRKKGKAYGKVAGETFLLLYSTHWQFLPSERVAECARSHVQTHGCAFAGVFMLLTNGSDLMRIEKLHPIGSERLPKPTAFEPFKLFNLEPGKTKWEIDATTS